MRDGSGVSGRLPSAISARSADLPHGDSRRGVESLLHPFGLMCRIIGRIVEFSPGDGPLESFSGVEIPFQKLDSLFGTCLGLRADVGGHLHNHFRLS